MNKKRKHILSVIKRIRDSFHESVAVYTAGRCYHFAKILQEIYGGEIYQDEDKGHIFLKLGEYFYDINGDAKDKYFNEDFTKCTKLTEDEELRWDSNHHSSTVAMFHKKYVQSR